MYPQKRLYHPKRISPDTESAGESSSDSDSREDSEAETKVSENGKASSEDQVDQAPDLVNFNQGAIKPVEMAKLLESLPDPSVLKPKVQLRQNKTA